MEQIPLVERQAQLCMEQPLEHIEQQVARLTRQDLEAAEADQGFWLEHLELLAQTLDQTDLMQQIAQTTRLLAEAVVAELEQDSVLYRDLMAGLVDLGFCFSFLRRINYNLKMVIQKNKKPEEIFKREIVSYLIRHGFDIDVVESKAVFSQKMRRYLHSQATPGMSDLVGNDMNGHACFIELKAPKKIKTLRDNQRRFLIKKIESNAFACVVDSIDLFCKLYSQWVTLRKECELKAKQFLIESLP